MDYGRPMKPFFIEISNFWADKVWGIWVICEQSISTQFGTVTPLFMFFNNQLFSYKKLSRYTHIPNNCLGFGFELELQKIEDLAFVLFVFNRGDTVSRRSPI